MLHGSTSVNVKVWLSDWDGWPIIDPSISTGWSPGGYKSMAVVVISNTPVAVTRVPIAHRSTPDAGEMQVYSIVQLESETVYEAVKEVGAE